MKVLDFSHVTVYLMSLGHKVNGHHVKMDIKVEFSVLEQLALENRHILSDWRLHLILRRLVDPFYPDDKIKSFIKRLEKKGLIEPIKEAGYGIYKVITPYARKSLNVHEAVSEAYYSSVFCYATALELHRLTDQRSRQIHIFLPKSGQGEIIKSTHKLGEQQFNPLIPLGSKNSDWRLVALPPYTRLSKINGFTVLVHRIKQEWFFGYESIEAEGVQVRCTDLERTLIDGLRSPKHFGGLNEVFRGWVRALQLISIDKLIEYAERLDQLILYQRLGFVMDTLNLEHQKLEEWKRHKTARGGSRVLDPESGYSSTFSEDWDLSINHPVTILETRDTSFS